MPPRTTRATDALLSGIDVRTPLASPLQDGGDRTHESSPSYSNGLIKSIMCTRDSGTQDARRETQTHSAAASAFCTNRKQLIDRPPGGSFVRQGQEER